MSEKKRSTTAESPKGKAPSKKAVPPQTSTTPKTRARNSVKYPSAVSLIDQAVHQGVTMKTINNLIEIHGGRKRLQDVPDSRIGEVEVALKMQIDAQVKANKLVSKGKSPILTPDQAKQKAEIAELLKEVQATMDGKAARIMLRKFGITAVKELTPDQYKDFYEHCKKELALFRGEPTELPVTNKAIPAKEMTITVLDHSPIVNHLRETIEALESGKFKHHSGGIVLNQENGRDDPAMRGAVTIKSDLVLGPNRDYRPAVHPDVKAASFQEQVTFQDHVRSVTGDMIQQMAEAESRRLAMQTEAAINLGIGFVIKALGQDAIAIHPDALKKFTSEHKVEQEVAAEGSVTIKVVPRN